MSTSGSSVHCGRYRHRAVPAVLLAVLAVLALVAAGCKAQRVVPATAGGTASSPAGRGDLPASMAALGDSITAGFGTCLLLATCPRNSWSSGDGTLVSSHYKRLAAANPAMHGHQHNYAVDGAVVADLAGQASQAVRAGAQYVTILIGANDACARDIDAMTSTTAFTAALGTALATLKAGLPAARVLVVSIPDVYQVWQVAHTNKSAVRAWSLGICPALLANPASTATADEQRRQRFRDRVDGYDTVLQRACAGYGPKCHYDGGAVHRVAFSVAQLSALDFFHPNTSGQNALAKATWYL